MIVRTFDTGTSSRTQFRDMADETIKRYVQQLETAAQIHMQALAPALLVNHRDLSSDLLIIPDFFLFKNVILLSAVLVSCFTARSPLG